MSKNPTDKNNMMGLHTNKVSKSQTVTLNDYMTTSKDNKDPTPITDVDFMNVSAPPVGKRGGKDLFPDLPDLYDVFDM